VSIEIKNFRIEDLDSIEYLQPEGWESIKQYFKFFHESNFCHPIVALNNDKIIGLANSILNKSTGWLSHIIVSDDFQRQGIGYQLTQRVMEILNGFGCKTQLLIATKMGEKLYLRLGFEKSCLYNFYINKQLDCPKNENIHLLEKPDFTETLVLDYHLSGEYRDHMIAQYFSKGYVYKNKGNVEGYFLPELGDGVVLASTNSAGIELLKFKHTIKNWKSVLPESNSRGNEFFKDNGFELHNQAYRMVYGKEVNWKPQSVFCRIGGFYA